MKRTILFSVISSVLLIGCVNTPSNKATEPVKQKIQHINQTETYVFQQICPIIAIEDKALVDIKESTYFINEYKDVHRFNYLIGLNLTEYSYNTRYLRLSLAFSKVFKNKRYAQLKNDPYFMKILEMDGDSEKVVKEIIHSIIIVPYLNDLHKNQGPYYYEYKDCIYSEETTLVKKLSKLGAENLKFVIQAVLIRNSKDKRSNDIILTADIK